MNDFSTIHTSLRAAASSSLLAQLERDFSSLLADYVPGVLQGRIKVSVVSYSQQQQQTQYVVVPSLNNEDAVHTKYMITTSSTILL